jgi:hypothetical protein
MKKGATFLIVAFELDDILNINQSLSFSVQKGILIVQKQE